MRLFRIADRRHPLWDGTGAALLGGRWNSPGTPVIYAATSHAGAMLEVLARSGIGRVPTTHALLIADVPDAVSIERVAASALPAGWDLPDSAVSRDFGDAWLEGRRSAVLLVPSVIAPHDWNAMVNPQHPETARIAVDHPVPVVWDRRLFRDRPPP
jgi:RES domain-containing protein